MAEPIGVSIDGDATAAYKQALTGADTAACELRMARAARRTEHVVQTNLCHRADGRSRAAAQLGADASRIGQMPYNARHWAPLHRQAQ